MVFAAVIIAEIANPTNDAAAPSVARNATVEDADAVLQSQVDVDALSETITARPLFTPGRRPPQPKQAAQSTVAPPPPKPPEIRGRLAGVVLGPGEREALFARLGEKPLAISVGGEIDGWTVASIDADQVVLTSAFGQRVMHPTEGERGEGVVPRPRPPAKRPVQLPVKRVAPVFRGPPPTTGPGAGIVPGRIQQPAQTASRARRGGAQP